MSLLTVPEARTALKWNAERDAELALLIAAIEEEAERYCERKFAVATDEVTERQIDWRVPSFRLPRWPVTALTVIGWAAGDAAPEADDWETGLLVRDIDYHFDPDVGSVQLYSGLAVSYVRTKATGGLNPIPAGLKAAILTELKYRIAVESPERIGALMKTDGRYASVQLKSDPNHPRFHEALDAYRGWNSG